MKKIYILLLTASTLSFAQKNTSFEKEEGYKLGNIDTQNGWEVAKVNDKKNY